MGTFINDGMQIVVYFDQPMGALHAVGWSKSFFGAKTTFSINFYNKMIKNAKNNNKMC